MALNPPPSPPPPTGPGPGRPGAVPRADVVVLLPGRHPLPGQRPAGLLAHLHRHALVDRTAHRRVPGGTVAQVCRMMLVGDGGGGRGSPVG